MLHLTSLAQDSLFYVKGYIITQYKKVEVENKLHNEYLIAHKKPFVLQYDYFFKTKYFTLEISDKYFSYNLIGDNDVIWNDEGNIEFYKYFTSEKQKNDFFKLLKLSKLNDAVFNDIYLINTIEFPNNSLYYYDNCNSNYLYKIFYIEGYAKRITIKYDIMNDSLKTRLYLYDLGVSNNNCRIPYFYMYIFYKVDVVDTNKHPTGFYLLDEK
jgi:hypothetical protein